MGLGGTLWNVGEAIFSGAASAAHAAGPGAAGALGTVAPWLTGGATGMGPAGMVLGGAALMEGVREGDAMAATQGGIGLAASTTTTVGGVAGLASGMGLGGSGVGALAGAAPWVAGPLAAAAAGLGIGTGIADAADSEYGRSATLFGTDEDTGQARTSYDMAADWGVSADNAVENLLGLDSDSMLGTILGGTTAALGGIATAPLGLATSAVNAISSW